MSDQSSAIRCLLVAGTAAALVTGAVTTADSCRNSQLRMRVRTFLAKAATGLPVRALMWRVAQPYLRRDLAFTYCARTRRNHDVRVRVQLTRDGRVRVVQPDD